ncbi:hypothetical protein [Marinomonas algicola]|uniref:hypothetical protein n=1 Tax=Marinomonas algicola TaxID=2773454 RepID=UPI00174E4403|nr:hypothetical protein [Marinomonas algicola]
MLKNIRIEIPLKPPSSKVVRGMDLSPTIIRVRLQSPELEGFGMHLLSSKAHVITQIKRRLMNVNSIINPAAYLDVVSYWKTNL